MNLQQIKDLKLHQSFKYNGELTQVDWREQVDEMVGTTLKNEEMWVHHFAMTFQFHGSPVTLRTMHPHPKVVKLARYTV